MSIKNSFFSLVFLTVISSMIYLFADEMQIKDTQTLGRNRMSLIEKSSPNFEVLNQSLIKFNDCNYKNAKLKGKLYINEIEQDWTMIKTRNPVREIYILIIFVE